MDIRISEIIQSIETDFVKVYRNASKFKKSRLYEDCLEVIRDYGNLRCIIFANDLGIVPTKAIIKILKDEGKIMGDLEASESVGIGCLMGYLFKNCLHYKNQKERIKLNYCGVKSATRFFDVEKFTISKV